MKIKRTGAGDANRAPHAWECSCSPADGWALASDFVGAALAGDTDMLRLVGAAVDHALAAVRREVVYE